MGEISTLGVLRLRAREPSVYDRSAKRFAQDDGFVRGLKYSSLDMQKTRDRSVTRSAQDDDFVVSFDEKHPKQAGACGAARPDFGSEIKSATAVPVCRACVTQFGKMCALSALCALNQLSHPIVPVKKQFKLHTIDADLAALVSKLGKDIQ
jgi:hypothetical protein